MGRDILSNHNKTAQLYWNLMGWCIMGLENDWRVGLAVSMWQC